MMETRASAGWLQQTDLFIGGQGGYHTYRIPALVVTSRGTVLAFCEGRRRSEDDSGEIDLLLRRSMDHGETWTDPVVVVSEAGMTCGNPCPVVDRATGAITLLFNKNRGIGDEKLSMDLILRGEDERTVWVTRSRNDGLSWDAPTEITDQVKPAGWTWYATGPGHGIQSRSGRLIAPCDHAIGDDDSGAAQFRSHVLYSDDKGESWHVGGVLTETTNECEAVELSDGRLYLNMRVHPAGGRRAYAYSFDAGMTWPRVALDDALVCPGCQGSLISLRAESHPDKEYVLFANPASTQRERMTVRLSADGGQTWSHARVLHAGPAAYSDLAVTSRQTIICFYECGPTYRYQKITLARFNLTWLLAPADAGAGRD